MYMYRNFLASDTYHKIAVVKRNRMGPRPSIYYITNIQITYTFLCSTHIRVCGICYIRTQNALNHAQNAYHRLNL